MQNKKTHIRHMEATDFYHWSVHAVTADVYIMNLGMLQQNSTNKTSCGPHCVKGS